MNTIRKDWDDARFATDGSKAFLKLTWDHDGCRQHRDFFNMGECQGAYWAALIDGRNPAVTVESLPPPPPVDRSRTTTTDGKPLNQSSEDIGQHKNYIVLTEEERKKGFVRPVRRSYKHVGVRPQYPLRDLTEKEVSSHKGCDYVKYETYPEGSNALGRHWTQKQLDSGCGATSCGCAARHKFFSPVRPLLVFFFFLNSR